MGDFERRQTEAMLQEIHDNNAESFNVRIGALSLFRKELNLSAAFLGGVVEWFEEAGEITVEDMKEHGCVFIERVMDCTA